MQSTSRPWWHQVTALVSVSVGGAVTGLSFVPHAAADLTSPAAVPIRLLALEHTAGPQRAAAHDATLRSAIVNVTNYYLRMAQGKTPAEMEAIIWQHDSVDGTDHGASCAAFASLTLELAAQAVGQRSWVTGGTSYPWPLHKWADARVEPNPASPGITSILQDAQAHQRWHPLASGYQPQPGDWVLFDGHVEVVTGYHGGVLHTVGGNSLPNFSVNAHEYPNPLGERGVLGFVNNGAPVGSQPAGQPSRDTSASRDASSQQAAGQQAAGQHAAGQNTTGQNTSGQHAAGQHATTRNTARNNASRHDSAGHNTPRHNTPGQDAAGQHASGQNTAGQNAHAPAQPPAQPAAAADGGGTAPRRARPPGARPARPGRPARADVPGTTPAGLKVAGQGGPPGSAAVPGLLADLAGQPGHTSQQRHAGRPRQAGQLRHTGQLGPHRQAAPVRTHPAPSAGPVTGTGTQQAFISEIAPGAIAAQHEYGVPASVTIAQAIVESGWGQSELATKDHNLFGIKGTGPAGRDLLPTQEYVDGQPVARTGVFRVYHNAAESIGDHGRLLATSGYYRQAMARRNDPNAFATALTGVYATDPSYGGKLIELMRRYDLYRYDPPAASPATGRAAATPGPGAAAGQPAIPGAPGPSGAATAPAPAPSPAAATSPAASAPARPRAAAARPAPTRRVRSAPASRRRAAAAAGHPVHGLATPTSRGHTVPAPGWPAGHGSSSPGAAAAGTGRQAAASPPRPATPFARGSAASSGEPGGEPVIPGTGAGGEPAGTAGGTARSATAADAAQPAIPGTAARADVAGSAGGQVTARTTAYQAPSGAAQSQPGTTPQPARGARQSAAQSQRGTAARPAGGASRAARPGTRRYQPEIPPPVRTAFTAMARVPLLHEEPLYRDVASETGIRWEFLAACDWMQCKAQPRHSPVRGEKLGTVNPDGTVYRTKSEALAQCAEDLINLAHAVYQIDVTAPRYLSVRELASVFAAFRWGGLLRLHRTSAMEFPYSVAGLTAQHTAMRWPNIDEPHAPDKPGSRFRMPFGAVPIMLCLSYPATV